MKIKTQHKKYALLLNTSKWNVAPVRITYKCYEEKQNIPE